MSKKRTLLSWFFQIIAAVILGQASYGKLIGNEMSVVVFELLRMGDEGRILIGMIEGVATLLLLTPMLTHWGALLGFGTMLGALIAHITVLGLVVNNDGGKMIMMLGLVLFSTMSVLFVHRKRLPLIGAIF